MTAEYAKTGILQSLLLEEIFYTFGMKRDGWARKYLWPLFWLPAHAFSRISARFDEIVARQGFDAAAKWVLPRFVKDIETTGDQPIPQEGPLLVVSNHPGSVDSLIIASQVHRSDFKIVATAIPFLMNMPATTRHMIYTSRDTIDRAGVLRSSVDHLKNGGSMLIFPSGHIDPDPYTQPEMKPNFGEWSRSIELFLRKVPETQLLISIVSNVLGREFVCHPVTHIRKKLYDRQKLAEYVQIMQQLVLPGSVNVIPRISFDVPITFGHLDQMMQSIVERARLALEMHRTAQFQRWNLSRS